MTSAECVRVYTIGNDVINIAAAALLVDAESRRRPYCDWTLIE